MGIIRKDNSNRLNKDKKEKKKKSSLIKTAYKWYIRITIFLEVAPTILQILLMVLIIILIYVGCLGILQLFEEKKEETTSKYEIDWGEYTCSCTHLTAEQIKQVQAGQEVSVDITNSGSLNVTGGSVASISGLTIPSKGALTSDGQYGIPIWSGYSMDNTGSDVIVPISTDNRYESKVYTTTTGNIEADRLTVAQRALHQGNWGEYEYTAVSYEYKGDVTTSNGRLEVAVASGFLAWPDNPDNSDTIKDLNFDIVLKNGKVIPAVVKDAKANIHTGNLHMYFTGGPYRVDNKDEQTHITEGTQYAKADYSFIELYHGTGESTTFLRKYIRDAGGIDHVKIYNHGRLEEGKKVNENAVDALALTSSTSSSTSTSQTTTSFGVTGTGTNQATSTTTGSTGMTVTSDYDVSKFNVSNAKGFVVVEGTGGSNCQVTAYKKNGSTWEKFVDTTGILGRSGMSNDRTEGDGTTPIGIWQLNTPFGLSGKLDGFSSNYIQVDENDWWSGDSSNNYNKLMLDYDGASEEFKAKSENIGSVASFNGAYDYALDAGYNKNGIAQKGSALFLHCKIDTATSTSGCVAIAKSEMIKIMKEYEDSSWYIVQAPKGTVSKLYDAYGANNGLSPTGDFSTSGVTSTTTSTGSSDSVNVSSVDGTSTSKFTNGQKIGLDSSWEYASFSKINSGQATYYTATNNRKNICISVNAGHGTKGGGSVKTQSHPDGTGKYTGGTNAQGDKESQAVSSGMEFVDGTAEKVINLKVALDLKEVLLERGYDVLMIREDDDVQLDNIARTVISNNVADAHIAIHFNSTTSDAGCFYMKVVDSSAYKAMEPVASHWQEDDELGESLVSGFAANGLKTTSACPSDLTQTSYSTIASVDIELGDKKSDISDSACQNYAKALADGVDTFFSTHQAVNQAKRGQVNLGNTTSSSTTSENSGSTTGTISGTINKNKANLRTSCQMAIEGICGCYISDSNCMCHIFAGEDGVLGTSDDNTNWDDVNSVGTGNIAGLTAEQSLMINTAKSVAQSFLDAIQTQYPTNFENGWKSEAERGGNIWYHPNSSPLSVTINGKTVSTRSDCSGYMSCVLYALGVNWVSTQATTDTFVGYKSVVQNDDRFIWLDYDKSILQPGDIVVRRSATGHTEMFAGWVDDSQVNVYAFSWGSTNSALRIMDASTQKVADWPAAYGGGSSTQFYGKSYNRNGIIRYVGSGGAGK